MPERIPLLYTLYTNSFYGTEQMSLATAWGLRDDFAPVIIAPPGPAVAEARSLGFEVVESRAATATLGMKTVDFRGYAPIVARYLAKHPRLAFVSTHPGHALCLAAVNLRYRRRVAQLHVMHGPPDVSRLIRTTFNTLPMTTVAISEYTRSRLLASGVRDRKIQVIENFLTADRVARAPRRAPFDAPGVRRAAVISRLVPVKRIDVLLNALERRPELRAIEFHLFGGGNPNDPYGAELEARAKERGLNVVFEGFRSDVPERLPACDLLVHLCPTEPFGLAILEAMAAGVPVVVPDHGGAASVVEDGISGSYFSANDPVSLGEILADLSTAPADRLNRFVSGGRAALETRFSDRRRLADYRELIFERLG